MVTANEYSILATLWKADRALTSGEILEQMENQPFKDRTIHSLLSSMLKKGLIYVDGQKLSSSIYSRCFRPKISFAEYFSQEITSASVYKKEAKTLLPGIVSRLVQDSDIGQDTIEELERLLEEKRSQLNNG
mgnify:CR=1 FL=1